MKRLFTNILSFMLVCCVAVPLLPSGTFATAWANEAEEEITADTPLPDMAAIQQRVDDATAVYDDAKERIGHIEQQIAITMKRIRAISAEMPGARTVSNQAASEYYRSFSTTNPLLDLVFSTTSFADFFVRFEYLQRVNQSYLDNINRLTLLDQQLETAEAELEAEQAAAQEEERRAAQALHDAEVARSEAEEVARKIAEATAAATAAAAAAAAAEAARAGEHVDPVLPKPNDGNGTGSSGSGSGGGGIGGGGTESPTNKQDFINLWAPRIDAYLAGSPLASYGYAFANAAFDYNVDPRWSPAIACLESSKGLHCFREHNAWGWGSINWPDWETAIYAHVYGLSSGYGYTISEAAAQKYCPPNWEYWFSFISGQMALI